MTLSDSATLVALAVLGLMPRWSVPIGCMQPVIAKAKCREYYDRARMCPAPPSSLEETLPPGDHVVDDPWGNPYVLERQGATFRVVSFGPDGLRGTGDDFAYPEP